MNSQQKQIAVARLDGWSNLEFYTDKDKKVLQGTYHPEHNFAHDVPDYLHSRDAIIPVIEKQLTTNYLKIKFVRYITGHEELQGDFKISESEPFVVGIPFECLFATPEQLVDALLKATGQWKD